MMFSGYSYDGTFLKDRKRLIPGIRAEWGKDYFAEIQYTRISGGAYNIEVDRDPVSWPLAPITRYRTKGPRRWTSLSAAYIFER